MKNNMSKEFNKEATDLIHEHIFEALERIEKQTTLTNGKLKKLTMALVAVASFSVGLGLVEARHILSLFL
jgi:hypothetical protein